MGHQSTGCVGPWMMGGCPPSLWMTPRSLPCHSTRLGGSRVSPTGPASAPVASVGPGLGGDVASIVVSRLKDPWINRFRKIGVEINGSLVGALRPGERGVFAVPVGHVSVRATIDWLGSKTSNLTSLTKAIPCSCCLATVRSWRSSTNRSPSWTSG